MDTRQSTPQRPRQNTSYLREFIFIVFDRQKIIIFAFCIVAIPSILMAFFLPSVYKASSKFSVEVPEQMDPLRKENSYDYKNKLVRFLQDQRELVLSNRVVEKAAQILYPNLEPALLIEKLDDVRKFMEVTPPSGGTFEESNVFYISFLNKNPGVAAQVTKALCDAYLDAFRDVSKAKTNYSELFFQEQTDKLYQGMQEKEQKLRQYETEQALVLIEILNLEPGKTNVEVGPNALLSQAHRKTYELQEELVGVKISINTLEKELRENKIPVVLPEMEVTGRAITVFKNKVAQLQIQLNEMRPQFSDSFAPLKQVEKELELNVKSLKEELQRTLQAQKMNRQAIEAKLNELDDVILGLQSKIQTTAKEKASYDHLKQEFNIAKDAYSSTRTQLERARMANSLSQDKQYVTMLDEPQLPSKPFKPNRPLLLIIGIVAGVLFGIAAALMVDHFDHSLKKPEDIEKYFELPILGSISRVG